MTLIDVIITAHQEKDLIKDTFISVKDNISLLPTEVEVSIFISLDDPDKSTRSIAHNLNKEVRCYEYDFKDVGLARNEVLKQGNSKYVAFIDAGDIWCSDWLLKTYLQITKDEEISTSVFHPYITFFLFDNKTEFIIHPSSSEDYNQWTMLLNNSWTSSFITSRANMTTLPFKSGSINQNYGYSYEDWSWNRDSLYLGFQHIIVPETVHFCPIKNSGNSTTSRRKNLFPHPSKLFDKLMINDLGNLEN